MTNIDWVEKAVFYHIYPLGAFGCPRKNEGASTAANRIREFKNWLPHLVDLGITAIYLGPIWESESHGYDTVDYFTLDSRLGTNEDFKELVNICHENGIRVVLDGVFNHVGREFFAVKDVLENREKSEYKDWISGLNFNNNNAHNDGLSYDCWSASERLVKLNLYNPDVYNHLFKAIGMWIDEFDIDGLRLDAADCIIKDFFKQLRVFTKNKKPDFWLMGEIIHGDYNIYANEEMLDSVTNYECWKGIYSSHNDHNYFEINYAMKRQWGQGGMYLGKFLYNFVDNHDVNRIGSLLKDKENIFPVYTLLFTMPGVPSIYYGSEWAVRGEKSDKDGDYPLRLAYNLKEMEKTEVDLQEHIKMLSDLRKHSKALQYGLYEEVQVKNETLVFARALDDEYVLVLLNNTSDERKLCFDYRGSHFELALPAHGSKILKG